MVLLTVLVQVAFVLLLTILVQSRPHWVLCPQVTAVVLLTVLVQIRRLWEPSFIFVYFYHEGSWKFAPGNICGPSHRPSPRNASLRAILYPQVTLLKRAFSFTLAAKCYLCPERDDGGLLLYFQMVWRAKCYLCSERHDTAVHFCTSRRYEGPNVTRIQGGMTRRLTSVLQDGMKGQMLPVFRTGWHGGSLLYFQTAWRA